MSRSLLHTILLLSLLLLIRDLSQHCLLNDFQYRVVSPFDTIMESPCMMRGGGIMAIVIPPCMMKGGIVGSPAAAQSMPAWGHPEGHLPHPSFSISQHLSLLGVGSES